MCIDNFFSFARLTETRNFLQDVKPEIPEYDAIRFRIRAYDFVPLESFAKYVHRFGRRMGIETDA